jgi:hypothetical protein
MCSQQKSLGTEPSQAFRKRIRILPGTARGFSLVKISRMPSYQVVRRRTRLPKCQLVVDWVRKTHVEARRGKCLGLKFIDPLDRRSTVERPMPERSSVNRRPRTPGVGSGFSVPIGAYSDHLGVRF